MLLLGGCQSSQIPPWLQGETIGGPRASQPPSQATRKPVPRPKANIPGTPPPSQTYPPIAGPRLPPAVKYPPAPAIPAREPGKETAAATPGEAKPQWPSFIPYLTRPPPEAAPAPEPYSTVPPPASEDIVRVALLLPLSGANAKLGQAMLNSAQLAVFDFADSRFELLTHDTKGTPKGAVAAAAAAIADGASMIMGPLLSASTRAVGPQARAANVPVLAFSSDRSVVGGGVYTLGFLPSAEIWRIVAYARSKGVRRYAALAPDNAYGETVISALEEAAAAHGSTITQVRFYDPNASDFSASVRALADYGARRRELLSQRRELEGRDDEISIKALKRLEKLQTIGDLPFDALLVADGGKRLQSIAALLPFYDIDPAKVRMLGTGQWDVPGLGAEPALIGGWFAAPPPPARADFENEYRAMYGQAPPRLATLSYDATALAAVLARNKKGPDFSASAITVSSGFWGRDGIFRFLPQGISERGLAVMRVGRRESEIISRAPETFEARIN